MMTMVDELRHLDGIKGNFYIESHGGRIWAENSVLDGKGTIFSFTLPLEIKSGIEAEKAGQVVANG
jgi:hypothetical protein